MTIAEKILARASGKTYVRPGEFVWAEVDSTNATIGGYKDLEKYGANKVFDPNRIYTVIDHQCPANSVSAANLDNIVRQGVEKYGITHFYEMGRAGILHQLYPEEGYVKPGHFIAMVDSHSTTYGAFNAASCAINVEQLFVLVTGKLWFQVPESIRFTLTGRLGDQCVGKDVLIYMAGQYGTDLGIYKSIEFTGEACRAMSLDSRWSMANMSSELGAKFAIFEADEKTVDFLRDKVQGDIEPVFADPDAKYAQDYTLDVSNIPPMVSCPHNPGNAKAAAQVEDVGIDQAFIGSCTNGRQEDLAMAAEILQGRKVSPKVRLIISPASTRVYKEALEKGWIETFLEAGALVCHPTCGPCYGGHLGILGDGEVCISATNRNFKGRMGSTTAQVYLGNAATVAASAVTGHITDPRSMTRKEGV